MHGTNLRTLVVAFSLSVFGACAESTHGTGQGQAGSDETGSDTSDTSDTTTTDGSSDASDADASSDTGNEGEQSGTDATGSDAGTGGEEPSDCDGSWAFVLKPDPSEVPSFMLVVDRSGSMNEEGRWQSTFSALTGVTETLEGMVDFGLMLFPEPGLDACASGRVSVEPAPNTAAAIRAVLETSDPLGGTPTATAIQEAGDWLSESNSTGSNYILLATDGGPGCNSGMDPNTCECIPGATCAGMLGMGWQNCLDSVRTANAVLVQRERGIKTFVVGLPGSEVVTDLLDTMAVAGGTAVNGQHYAVTSEADLIEALGSASGSTIPCDFPMETVPTDLSTLEVTLDGQSVSRDETHTSGWDVVDGRFRLYGSTCTEMRNGQPHELHVQFDCD